MSRAEQEDLARQDADERYEAWIAVEPDGDGNDAFYPPPELEGVCECGTEHSADCFRKKT